MPSDKLPEVWLRGPVAGVSPLLMPAAHCLLQCREEISAAADLTTDQLWAKLEREQHAYLRPAGDDVENCPVPDHLSG